MRAVLWIGETLLHRPEGLLALPLLVLGLWFLGWVERGGRR